MQRSALIRGLTLVMAFVHTFPARRHIAALFVTPSLEEGWKGFGALIAIAIYLLPVSVQARGICALWRRYRWALGAGCLVLALAHAVPAADHLPRFVANPSWADAWRGCLSALAALWFLTPMPAQARALNALVRAARIPIHRPMWRSMRPVGGNSTL
jgi:hypothetical protein